MSDAGVNIKDWLTLRTVPNRKGGIIGFIVFVSIVLIHISIDVYWGSVIGLEIFLWVIFSFYMGYGVAIGITEEEWER